MQSRLHFIHNAILRHCSGALAPRSTPASCCRGCSQPHQRGYLIHRPCCTHCRLGICEIPRKARQLDQDFELPRIEIRERTVQQLNRHLNTGIQLLTTSCSRFDHSTIYEGSGDAADDQVIDASDYGPACPQHEAVSFAAPNDLGLGSVLSLLEGTPLLQSVLKQSEDCLSINVQRPQNESLTDLPVVVWM